MTAMLIVAALPLLVVANLVLGRPDDTPEDATLGEQLALRVRPMRLALTVAVALVLLAGGFVALAKGGHAIVLALFFSAAAPATTGSHRTALAYV
jgi:heme A synthase